MLKIAVAVSVEPMAMQFRQMLKKTTNQTALTGVWVYLFTLERVLNAHVLGTLLSVIDFFFFIEDTYEENGRASSRAKA